MLLVILWELAHGLQIFHEEKVIHRDMKAENVFVTEDGHYKIGDYNLSKPLENSLGTTTSLVGTMFWTIFPFYSSFVISLLFYAIMNCTWLLDFEGIYGSGGDEKRTVCYHRHLPLTFFFFLCLSFSSSFFLFLSFSFFFFLFLSFSFFFFLYFFSFFVLFIFQLFVPCRCLQSGCSDVCADLPRISFLVRPNDA
jgi:serine/threonine protein kinase